MSALGSWDTLLCGDRDISMYLEDRDPSKTTTRSYTMQQIRQHYAAHIVHASNIKWSCGLADRDMTSKLPVMQYRLAWRHDPLLADQVGAFCILCMALSQSSSCKLVGRLDMEGGMYIGR